MEAAQIPDVPRALNARTGRLDVDHRWGRVRVGHRIRPPLAVDDVEVRGGLRLPESVLPRRRVGGLALRIGRFCGRRFFSQNTLASSRASNSLSAASVPDPWNGEPTDKPVTLSVSAGSYVVVTAIGLMMFREMVSLALKLISP